MSDLNHVRVDHDEVADSKITTLHPDRGKNHDPDQPARDQEGLSEIQEGQ